MIKSSMLAVVPSYLNSFQCLGAECPETCCQGWSVAIDARTYEKYKLVKIHSLAHKLDKVVTLNDKADRSKFAMIHLGKEDRCPMLTQKGLCEIQSKLGEGYLSDTCKYYPRAFSMVNEELRCFATMSCPAVASLALLDPSGLNPDKMVVPVGGGRDIPLAYIVKTQKSSSLVVEYFEPIQEVVGLIMRHPQLSASEAMIVLSLLVQQIQRCIAEPDQDSARAAIVRVLTDYCRQEYCLEVRDAMAVQPRHRHIQMELLRDITLKYLIDRPVRGSLQAVFDEALQGIDFGVMDLVGSEARYREAETSWFEPFDRQHAHLLKNYLLNDMGKNVFPVGSGATAEDAFLNLAVRFCLIRLYLVGVAGLKKEAFSEQDYVRVIYSFSRNVEHTDFIPVTLGLLKNLGYANLASAVILLR